MADDTEMKVEPQAEAEAPAAEPAATEQAAAAAPEAEPAKEEPAKEEPAAESAAAEGVENAGEGEEEDAGEGEGEEAEGDAEGGEEGAEEGGATPAGESKKRKPDGPIQLGYKTFQDLKSCQEYFKTMLNNMPLDTDVNEYEYRVLLDLIQQGHPNAAKKIGGGLRAFQVRRFNVDPTSRAFYAMRKDGSYEDFSYLKCTFALWGEEPSAGLKRHHGGRGGGGGDGGGGFRGGRGGRGFGGRGGRDGGRGRGGGRGGRFSRGRGRGRF